MNNELTYALITPYSLFKSRTGGIIGRILGLANLDLVDVRMFIFSDAFVDRYIETICPEGADPVLAAAWRGYLDRNLRTSNSWHYAPRCMVMLFRGPDAARHLREDVIGSFTEAPLGDTIRGTFGDFIRDEDGSIRYFEPAVITAATPELAPVHLRLFAEADDTDGGILTDRIQYDSPENIQTTLVLITPENFELHSRRPGNVIDILSRTGLKIVGSRLLPMSVEMAEKLYGPLREQFTSSLIGHVARQVYARLHDAFPFPVTMQDAEAISSLLTDRNAAAEFGRIVEYMTGVNPEELDEPGNHPDGRAWCLALLYQGPHAIEKVRSQLAGVNPLKVESGSYQSEFARNLVRNGAHASESQQQADLQRAIVGLADDSGDLSVFTRTIEAYLEQVGGDG